jgi:hypothetical protein
MDPINFKSRCTQYKLYTTVTCNGVHIVRQHFPVCAQAKRAGTGTTFIPYPRYLPHFSRTQSMATARSAQAVIDWFQSRRNRKEYQSLLPLISGEKEEVSSACSTVARAILPMRFSAALHCIGMVYLSMYTMRLSSQIPAHTRCLCIRALSGCSLHLLCIQASICCADVV